jgi:hypothetical protein
LTCEDLKTAQKTDHSPSQSKRNSLTKIEHQQLCSAAEEEEEELLSLPKLNLEADEDIRSIYSDEGVIPTRDHISNFF